MDRQDKILIVDDENSIRLLIRQHLTGEGYMCEEASSTEQALDRLADSGVALALVDIKMPGKSGIELLSEIKKLYSDTQVIMVTAVVDINTAIESVRKGAYDYITKPFNLEQMVLSVRRALEKRRLELQNVYYGKHLERMVEEQAKKIRVSFISAITALAYALEAKDKYTSGHSQRVSELSVAIASELGMSSNEVEKIRLAGLTHDIGKIGIRESILNKPGRLTEAEYQHIKSHPLRGEHILTPVAEDVDILAIVRHHHERYDGKSYPDGIGGEQIPIGARILAVSDSYDAMTSERPYRKALSANTACCEIEKGKGSQFDPLIADCFLKKAICYCY